MSISVGDKVYNSAEEMFNDMDAEFKKSNPIGYWMDNSLFKGKSLGHYAPHYSLTHPWKLIEDGFDQLRWAWQRVFKGYDERVIWSIDSYLANMIPQWIMQLKENGHGTPMEFFTEKDEYVNEHGTICTKPEADIRAKKEWNNVLDKIADGFEAYKVIQDEVLYPWGDDSEKTRKYNKLNSKYEIGFDLLKKWFGSLWD